MMAPPPPPAHHEMVFWKGYQHGWNEGHSAGFGKGYSEAMDTHWGTLGKGKGSRGWQEEDTEAAGGKKKKKPKKGSGWWEEWKKKYTELNPDQTTPYYFTRLGEKEIAIYPQEIQEMILEAADSSEHDGVSKDIEYDMTGGVVVQPQDLRRL